MIILISQPLKDGIPPEQQSSVTVSFEVEVALPSMNTSVEDIICDAYQKLLAALRQDAITVHGDVAFLEQLHRRLETTLCDISECDCDELLHVNVSYGGSRSRGLFNGRWSWQGL